MWCVSSTLILLAKLVSWSIHDIVKECCNGVILLNPLYFFGTVCEYRHFTDKWWCWVVHLDPCAVGEVCLVDLHFNFDVALVGVPEPLNHGDPKPDDVVSHITVEWCQRSKSHGFELSSNPSRLDWLVVKKLWYRTHFASLLRGKK